MRRNAHQPGHGQPAGLAARGEEGIGILRQHAGLLRLGAGIYFGKQQRRAALLLDFLRQGLAQAGPVNGMNGVKQRHRFLGLVGLQRSDQMQLDAGMRGHQRRPFVLGLLHAIFAEDVLAGGYHRLDGLDGESLRHRHQFDIGGITPGIAAGARDFGTDVFKPG